MPDTDLKKQKITSSVLPTGAATEAKQNDIIAALGGAVNEKIIVDDTTTADVTYLGYAVIATDESAASWKIKKLDETTGLLKIFYADGDANYDNIWTNRATTIVYS